MQKNNINKEITKEMQQELQRHVKKGIERQKKLEKGGKYRKGRKSIKQESIQIRKGRKRR